jgi:ubiquinone/menaquinone biosynthesis C-methylase UbiE
LLFDAAHDVSTLSVTPPPGAGIVDSHAEASGMTAARERWQLEGESAELYERYLVPPVTLPWAVDLVERVGVEAGERVLDVACGTGAVARVAAARVGGSGRVVGVDVNRAMLRVARARMPELEWREGSVLALPFADGEFDVLFCQLGLQFFPDRPAASSEMRRVLARGGRLGASVYSSIERNPAADALASSLDRRFGEGASRAKRHEHALADPAELAGLLAAAGFADVRVEPATLEVRFASVEEWVRIQFAATPLAALLEGREPPERERLIELVGADVGARLTRFVGDGGLAFPQEAHVAVATAVAA